MDEVARRKAWVRLGGALGFLSLSGLILILVPGVPRLLSVGLFVGAGLAILGIMRFRPEVYRDHVEIDGRGVLRVLPSGKTERCDWSNLVRVLIETTSDGPMGEDAFWLLVNRDDSGVVVSNAHAVKLGLLNHLHRLPRFDFETSVRAMGSVVDARFLVWEGSPGEGTIASVPLVKDDAAAAR